MCGVEFNNFNFSSEPLDSILMLQCRQVLFIIYKYNSLVSHKGLHELLSSLSDIAFTRRGMQKFCQFSQVFGCMLIKIVIKGH